MLTSSKFKTVFSCIRLNKIIHLLLLFLLSTTMSNGKHNYQTRSATQNLLDTPLARTNKYGKGSAKYQCIRDWNNFKKKFPQIPENKLSYMKIKRILKQAIFDQYWTFLFTTINFYMCTLYYFYFLSSRVIQLTPYFMILLVLIFIVNQNFKLLNRHSILLLFSFVLLPFCFLYFFSYYCLRYCCPIIIIVIYLLLLLFTRLFIYSYLLHHLFIYFVVLTCTRYNLLSPLST